MAIIKVSQFNSAPTAVSDYEAQNAHIMAFINQVNSQAFILTNPTGTTEPTIKQDTYINHGGTLYTVDTTDESITGSPADGNVYIKLSVSGDNLVASYVTDISAYTWNQVYGYLASGTDIILPYMLVKSGTSWTKYRMDIRNPAKIVTTTVNTGQGDNELYPMNQAVRTTDDTVFSSVTSIFYTNNVSSSDLYLYKYDLEIPRTVNGITSVMEISFPFSGSVKVTVTMRHDTGTDNARLRIIDGSGTTLLTLLTSSTTYVTLSDSLNVSYGKRYTVYIDSESGADDSHFKDFKISGNREIVGIERAIFEPYYDI